MNSSLYNLAISCYIMLYLVGGIATPLKHMTSSVGIVPTCNDGRCKQQNIRRLDELSECQGSASLGYPQSFRKSVAPPGFQCQLHR